MSATGFDPLTQQHILARSFYSCEVMVDAVCQHMVDTIHHRQPRGMGGRKGDGIVIVNSASNGLSICLHCHNHIERNRLWAKDHGFIVSRYEVPSEVAVWWRCAYARDLRGNWEKQYVLLDDDGGMTTCT